MYNPGQSVMEDAPWDIDFDYQTIFGSQEADIVADIGGENGKKDKPTNVFMGPVRNQMQVPGILTLYILWNFHTSTFIVRLERVWFVVRLLELLEIYQKG